MLKSVRKIFQNIGPHIVHLGIAFIIIGYAGSQTMTAEQMEFLREGDTMVFDDYKITITEVDIEEDIGDKESKEYWDKWVIYLEVYLDDVLVQKGNMEVIFRYSYDERGLKYLTRLGADVFVVRLPMEDLYINFVGFDKNEIEIKAKTIPMMNFLWGGMVMLFVGITIRIIMGYIPKKEKPEIDFQEDIQRLRRERPMRIETRPAPKIKETKDYEKMLEEELGKLKD